MTACFDMPMAQLKNAVSDPKPVLIFSWGNPDRGDDAVGPRLTALLEEKQLTNVELQTDFQLQIEHCLDLQHRRQVYLVDASMDADEPFRVSQVKAGRDPSFTSHALTPSALLAACEASGLEPGAKIDMLEIRGYDFELGHPITKKAQQNLDLAIQWLLARPDLY